MKKIRLKNMKKVAVNRKHTEKSHKVKLYALCAHEQALWGEKKHVLTVCPSILIMLIFVVVFIHNLINLKCEHSLLLLLSWVQYLPIFSCSKRIAIYGVQLDSCFTITRYWTILYVRTKKNIQKPNMRKEK